MAHESATLLLSYPDVLMATVAGLLFVGVGVVSMRASRRRMRYETWYYLHLYTYLAVALAFAHQLATGADFLANPWARTAWVALYAGTAAAVLWWRVAVPLRSALRQRLRVESVRREGPGVVSVVVAGPRVGELATEPGQFFRWRFLTRDLWWVSSPYSLSAAPQPDRLRLTAKALGDHSAQLARLRRGTRVLAEGPYGAMTAARRRRARVLLVAGGVGITPLRALFGSLPAAPGELTLVYRVGAARDVLFRAELEAIARERGARLHLVVGHRADLGGDPLSAAALSRLVPDLAAHDVYVCGPPGLVRAVRMSLAAAGVPRRHVHSEGFAW